MVRFLLGIATGVLRRRAKRLFLRDTWFVAYRRLASPTVPELRESPEFRTISPPRRRFYADPFVMQRNGNAYIFFEDYSYESQKGVISCATVNGNTSEIRTVLARDYHLAYPCVFEWDGAVYMIPESAGAKRIELYVATDFPSQWKLDRVLLDGVAAVDTTIHHDGRRFWLFTTIPAEPGAPRVDELFLFSADSLDEPWTPHPHNPVVSDVRRARPGGHLFRDQRGRLIRPAQDCSTKYGHAIVLHHVTRLDPEHYEEMPVGRIDADWGPQNIASHTYNFAGGYEVLDGMAARLR